MDFNQERIKEAKLWFVRAIAAQEMAELAFKNKLYPESAYNSQQTCEKSLKTILSLFGENIQEHKVFSYFEDLVNLKYDFNFERILKNAFELERHWLSSKYPIKRNDGKIINPEDLYSKEKTQKLLKSAKEILIDIKKFLKEELDLEF